MMKKALLFLGLVLMAGVAKAGWFDDPNVQSDQYTVFYTSAPMGVSASTTVCLVSLSSNTWPHPTGARAIIVDSVQIDNDKTAATTSIVKIGVVREVNASSGTVVWFERMGQGINVSNTNTFQYLRYEPGINARVNPVSPNFGPNKGTTPYLLSNDLLEASTVLTTGLPLACPVAAGFIYKLQPGDIVMNVVNSAVVANLNVTIRYHLEGQ